MVSAQFQIPEELYAKAKKLAEQREISLAELARRGLEYMLSVYPTMEVVGPSWQPPEPRHLGWKDLSDTELKDEAQCSSAEENWRR
jgi:hypothetical protein